MPLDPVQQVVEIAALVHRVKVWDRAVVAVHPVGRDRGHVGLAHDELSEIVDAVIDVVEEHPVRHHELDGHVLGSRIVVGVDDLAHEVEAVQLVHGFDFDHDASALFRRVQYARMCLIQLDTMLFWHGKGVHWVVDEQTVSISCRGILQSKAVER